MITIFTPSFADLDNTNAQNLTVKEIVARLPADQFHVTMFREAAPDPRIALRPQTTLWKWRSHGNTAVSSVRLLGRIPDIYFFPRTGPFDDIFFRLRKCLRWKTRVVTYYVTGGLDQRPPAPEWTRNLREADVVIGNSRYVSTLLREKLDIQAGTIYDGVDRRFYFACSSDGRVRTASRTVLFAGSFRPYKRADLLVREAARWPDVQFRLAGDGEQEAACRALAEQLGCRNVAFLGRLSQAKLGDEMRRADVFFFPSILEGHPQVLLQAAACGLPCVARSSYRPEFVLPGKTGFLAGSDQELSECLARLLNDEDLRKSFSAAAALHAAQFDLDRLARDWAEVFLQVSGAVT